MCCQLFDVIGPTAAGHDDAVTIEVTWWVGGVDIGEVGPTLSDAFDAGDLLQCVATPHDGEEAGDSVPSLEALVANTLPGMPDVVIQPALPMTADPLDCSLTGPAADLMKPFPREMLYDTHADPHEIRNLAASPDATHQAALKRLRAALDTWQTATNDRGHIPEPAEVVAPFTKEMHDWFGTPAWVKE